MKKKKRVDHSEELESLEIDPNALDKEWTDQPRTYGFYAIALADANAQAEEMKANLELLAAEYDSQIRENPEEYGLEKITENAIRNVILTQEEYDTLATELRTIQHRAGVLKAVVFALDHRKKALEKLVDLRLADYFSEPKASKAARSQMEKVSDRTVASRGQQKRKRKES